MGTPSLTSFSRVVRIKFSTFSALPSSTPSNPAMKTISLLLGSMPRNGEGALPSFDTSNAFLRGDAELFSRIFDKKYFSNRFNGSWLSPSSQLITT